MASRAPPDGKEAPMDALFTLAGPEWSPPAEMGPLTSLAASHGSLFVSSAHGALLRLGVASAEYEPLDPPAAARGSPSHTLFVDPHTPSAFLLALPSGESHYFFKGKGRGLPKLKGIRLTAAAWARVEASRPEVRDVVLGDARGVLYEASLEPARTRTFRQIHLLTPAAPVCGLHLEAFPAAGDEKRLLLLAATPSRLFEFAGGPTLDALVASPPLVRFAAASPPAAAAFPAPSLATHRRPNGAVASFACLCAGQLHFASLAAQPAQSSSLVMDFGSVPLPRVDPDGKDMADKSAAATVPTAMALTEFHFLLLYDSCLLAVSRLNHKVACRALPPRQWTSGARLLGLAHDASKGVLWAWGGAGVLRVRVHREERHVWRLHLEAARFAEALSYCSPTESMQRDAVLTAQAEHVFKEGQYELAATQYAKTKQTVEDVAMRFVAASQTAALKTYLLHKFDLVAESDVAQLTMLCTWLTEIYLRAMSAAPPAALAALRREFREFLGDKRRFLHRGTTHALIAAQGRAEEALHYALLCADFERAISLHIQQGHHDEALALLSSLLRGDVRLEGEAVDARNPSDWRHEAERLLEKFSPQLIVAAPVQLVDVWIQAAYLEPQRLLPAIMSYEQRYEHGQLRRTPSAAGELPHEGIRYLQHCVDEAGCDNEAVCNCLVLLHAKHSSDAKLFEYLSGVRQEGGSADADDDASGIRAAASDAAAATEALGIGLASLAPSYDAQYALRVCRELNRHEGCVLIYQRRGMHAEAVDLALSLGRLDLAKRSANLARADSAEAAAVRKRLWLQVAAHVVSAADGASVHGALALIAECTAPGDEPLLQLEDLLPLFPDFTIIDDFKEPVCSSLASYAERMKELRAEMEDAVSACVDLRAEIEKVEGREISVPPHQACDCKELASLDITTCCGQGVGGHRHIAYPCQHAFRVACLLATLKDRAVAFDEEGLAAECPLCGEFMVESISRPFVDAHEVQTEGSWAIDEARVYSLE